MRSCCGRAEVKQYAQGHTQLYTMTGTGSRGSGAAPTAGNLIPAHDGAVGVHVCYQMKLSTSWRAPV